MTITLTPEQQKWIEAQVEAGQFTSVEEAVWIAVTELMVTPKAEVDAQIAHLRDLIKEGEADLAAGRVHRYSNADELTADIVARGEKRFRQRS